MHINYRVMMYYLDLFEGILKIIESVFFSKYFVFLGGGGYQTLHKQIPIHRKLNKRHFACGVS